MKKLDFKLSDNTIKLLKYWRQLKEIEKYYLDLINNIENSSYLNLNNISIETNNITRSFTIPQIINNSYKSIKIDEYKEFKENIISSTCSYYRNIIKNIENIKEELNKQLYLEIITNGKLFKTLIDPEKFAQAIILTITNNDNETNKTLMELLVVLKTVKKEI